MIMYRLKDLLLEAFSQEYHCVMVAFLVWP